LFVCLKGRACSKDHPFHRAWVHSAMQGCVFINIYVHVIREYTWMGGCTDGRLNEWTDTYG